MGNQKLIHSGKMNWVNLLLLVASAVGSEYGLNQENKKITELQSIDHGQTFDRCQLALMNQPVGILGNQVFQGNLVKQFDTWGPCFEISFSMKLNCSAETNHWYNLFQFTATDNAYGNPGDRVPGVWFKKNKLGWNFTVDAGKSHSENRTSHTLPMKIGKWYRVKIVQQAEFGMAQFSLEVDGKVVYTHYTTAIQYNNVKWYQCNKGVKPRNYGPQTWNEKCIGEQIVLSDMAVNPGQTYKGETIFGDVTTTGSDETGDTMSGEHGYGQPDYGHNVIPIEFIANEQKQISNGQKPLSNGYQLQHNG